MYLSVLNLSMLQLFGKYLLIINFNQIEKIRKSSDLFTLNLIYIDLLTLVVKTF